MLDVFAGTGAVALEALSRGAGATCIEQRSPRGGADRRERRALRRADRCAIIRDTVERALQRPVAGGPFDIIVLDPPYDYGALDDAVRTPAASSRPAASWCSSMPHA